MPAPATARSACPACSPTDARASSGPDGEHHSDDDYHHREQIPREVVWQQVDAVTDLMQTEQLVLDGAVIERDRPRPQRDTADPSQPGQPPPATKVGQHEQRDD